LPPILSLSFISASRAFLAFVPPYLRDCGMGEEAIGMLMGVFRLAPILVLIPFGMLGDRLEPRRLITAGLGFFAVALALAAPTTEFLPLLVLFLLVGMAGSLFQVNNQATYFKTLGSTARGTKVGWYQGIRAMGFGIGPLVGGVVIHAGWVTSPMLVGCLLILPFVFLSLVCERVPGSRISLLGYGRDVRRPGVLILATVVLLFSFHFGVELTSFTLFLEDVLHQSKEQIGYTYLYISTVLVAVMLVTGFVSDRVHRPLAVGLLALLCSGVGNAAMVWVGSLGWLLAVRFLHVIGDGAFMVFQSVTIANLFHRRRMGGNLGLFVMVGNVGAFIGASVSGYIPGNVYPFLAAGILSFVGIIIFVLFGRPLWQVTSESAGV